MLDGDISKEEVLEIINIVQNGYNLYRGLLLATVIFGLIVVGLIIYVFVLKRKKKGGSYNRIKVKRQVKIIYVLIGISVTIVLLCLGSTIIVKKQNYDYLANNNFNFNITPLKLIDTEEDEEDKLKEIHATKLSYKVKKNTVDFKYVTTDGKKGELKLGPTDAWAVLVRDDRKVAKGKGVLEGEITIMIGNFTLRPEFVELYENVPLVEELLLRRLVGIEVKQPREDDDDY